MLFQVAMFLNASEFEQDQRHLQRLPLNSIVGLAELSGPNEPTKNVLLILDFATSVVNQRFQFVRWKSDLIYNGLLSVTHSVRALSALTPEKMPWPLSVDIAFSLGAQNGKLNLLPCQSLMEQEKDRCARGTPET
jgi:hypothetical protein